MKLKTKKLLHDIICTASVIGAAICGILLVYKEQNCYAVGLVFLVILSGIIELWYESQKEKISPINLERTEAALNYACKQRCGTKDDFIAATSLEMYNHLIKIGVIHEVFLNDFVDLPTDKKIWQITLKGKDLLGKL